MTSCLYCVGLGVASRSAPYAVGRGGDKTVIVDLCAHCDGTGETPAPERYPSDGIEGFRDRILLEGDGE